MKTFNKFRRQTIRIYKKGTKEDTKTYEICFIK